MSHLDEGTVHALLDGELETTEVAEITAHLSGCSACAQRYREAKEFRAEADRLIESVELAETQAPRGPSPVVDTPAAPPRAPQPPIVERPIREPVREPSREAAPAARPSEPRRTEPPAAETVPPPRPVQPRPETRPADSTPAAARAPEPPRAARPPRPQPVPEPEPARPELWNAPPPPLLIPDNESRAERRFRMMRRLGVAATILVVVGTAALAYKLRPGPPPVVPDDSVVTTSGPTGVVSSLERSGVPSGAMQKADTVPEVPAPSVPRPEADANPPAASRQPAALANAARSEAPAKPKPVPVAKQQPPAEVATSGDSAQDSVAAGQTTDTGTAEADSTAGQDLADVRRRAAEAMQELDRDRRRDQAAAATAALDAQRRRNARPPAAAAAPPPAPPTIEQRAGIYLRIGLDEASRQLGGPAHVIEGMSASFMGLAPGGAVAGADSTRPVVRVVYQDTQGRLILLDQQRLRSGQAPPQGPLAWAAGETALWLRGEAPVDALRALRPRVR